MRRTSTRLLAAAITGATLLGLTTAPARAAAPFEATASPYAFIGNAGQESITVENQRWTRPEYVADRTAAHPGWSIHLSDERLGAGLPRQDIRAYAGQGETAIQTAAWTKGFISLMDRNNYDVPFLVFKFGGDNEVCEGFVGFEQPRLFVRKLDGELHEVLDLTSPAEAWQVTSPDSLDAPGPGVVTIEVKRVSTAAHIADFDPFRKYAGRERVRADGHEIVMTYPEPGTGTKKTLRLLAGTRAVSC
ncbi:hypothetical protein [Lentzea sp. NPDC051838]|uniref:hypothetical protein n=1 Tax=Lentzea sp. NPDC051838 TaxID=3154849 RepID=UPI0034374FD3